MKKEDKSMAAGAMRGAEPNMMPKGRKSSKGGRKGRKSARA